MPIHNTAITRIVHLQARHNRRRRGLCMASALADLGLGAVVREGRLGVAAAVGVCVIRTHDGVVQ